MKEDRDQPGIDDSALDALLAAARWPGPTRQREERLAAFCRSLNRPAVPTRWLIAATVLLAAGLWLAIDVHRGAVEVPHQIARRDGVRPELRADEMTAPAPNSSESFVSRAPTRVELAFVAAADQRAKRNATIPAVAEPPDPVLRAVELLTREGSPGAMTAARDLVSGVGARSSQMELLRLIQTGASNHRQAAVVLLAALATPETIPVLIDLDRAPGTRQAAVEGLSRVAPPGLLAALARSHTDPAQRRALIAGLLRSEQGAGAYLELVADTQTSAASLGALDAVASAPTEAFFAALNDPHVSVRLAAARVLGRIDGAQTTARLIAMAERNQNRREALIALADSRGPEARRFLLEARTSGPLAGAVRSILLGQNLNE